MHGISFNPSFQEWQALFTIAPFKGTVSGISNEPHAQTHTPNPLVNVNSTVCCTGYAYGVSALFTQCPGDTVETRTGKVDPARKFKCSTAARAHTIYMNKPNQKPNSPSFSVRLFLHRKLKVLF